MKQRKKWLAASTKIAALAEYQSKSLSLRAVARKYDVTHVTILNWAKDKDCILQECRESAKLFPAFDSISGRLHPLSEPEEQMAKGKSQKTLLAEIKALKQENAYLADKVAYLEALATLEGIPASTAVKKNGSKQSGSPLKKEDEPT